MSHEDHHGHITNCRVEGQNWILTFKYFPAGSTYEVSDLLDSFRVLYDSITGRSLDTDLRDQGLPFVGQLVTRYKVVTDDSITRYVN